jgi:hypothetical protein
MDIGPLVERNLLPFLAEAAKALLWSENGVFLGKE